MAAELSFLALKTVAAFQDVKQVVTAQAVCKNWCWGMREQAVSITTDSVCSGSAGILTRALQSGSCCPDRFILDVVGQTEQVSEEAVQKLADFLISLQQQKWFCNVLIVQELNEGGDCSAAYTRKSGYSTHWQLENAGPLIEVALPSLPVLLQALTLRCEKLPPRGALSSLTRCTTLHTLHIDCHQGTLFRPDVEPLLALGPSLKALSIALPELHKSAVEALIAGLPGLLKLRLDRKTTSVCASVLVGVVGLQQLEELRLVGFGPASITDLKELSGLTALELSHACMAFKEDWEAIIALTGLKELHLIPAASALMPHALVACPVPMCLPHLSSLQMLVPCEPHALASIAAASQLRTLHLYITKQQDDTLVNLTPLRSLSHLRSLTLSGPTLAMNDAMLCMLCSAAQQVTHLAVLGRIGPFGPDGLSPMRTALTDLKHLSLGAKHMDQMFVLDVDKELPDGLEVLELSAACIIQQEGAAPLAALAALQENESVVDDDFGYGKSDRIMKQGYKLERVAPISRSISKPVINHQVTVDDMQLPGSCDACHVDKMAARSASSVITITPDSNAVADDERACWAMLRVLRLHKCCGVPAGSTQPDSTMRQPVMLNLASAKLLTTVALTDCTLADVSVHAVLAGCAVKSLTLAPYENWRGTAAQLSAHGMQAVLWAPAAESVRKLELRLTHRMHRDGTDGVLMTKVFPGLNHLRSLKVFTEESHWHRLPPTKALGRLRSLQQLHVGAVHERKIPAFIAGLQQVLPTRCKVTVVKYSPDLLEEQ